MGITILANNRRNENTSMFGAVSGAAQNKGSKKSIFAGNMTTMDPIEQKRQQAQRKAMKIVSDAWANDSKIDDSMQMRRDDFAARLESKEAAEKQLVKVEQNMKDLQEAYGVEDGSEEQKDLLILEKYYDAKAGVPHEDMTDEEKSRLAELLTQPRTEYQKAALELNDQAGMWKKEIQDAKAYMTDDVKDLASIARERLKTHPMVDAQKEKEAVLEAANKEILGMLIDEGKKYLDEKREEEQEKAEEKKEEEKKEEERLEKIEEKQALQEALIEGTKEDVAEALAQARQNEKDDYEITDILQETVDNAVSGGVSKSLEDIRNSMKLLEADLKGIKVDQEV